MRVVLYYDLLRFSPRSIDLFISMNISPPSLQQKIKQKARCFAAVQKAHYFRVWLCIIGYIVLFGLYYMFLVFFFVFVWDLS